LTIDILRPIVHGRSLSWNGTYCISPLVGVPSGLPLVSLIAVLLTSAELFTGDAPIFVCSVGWWSDTKLVCRNRPSHIRNILVFRLSNFLLSTPDSLKDVDKEEYVPSRLLSRRPTKLGEPFFKELPWCVWFNSLPKGRRRGQGTGCVVPSLWVL
jgi:hypothetical protein